MEPHTRSESEAPAPVSTGCCPPFDPAPWQDGEVVWRERPFVKDHVHCLFHVPLSMGAHMTHNQRLIEAAKAKPEQPLMLCDESSPWGADLYISVSESVPGAQMTTLSGTFLTKVYEGPYRNAGKWTMDMQQYVASKHREIEKLYLAYTTCPSCAQAYGKNYVIAFAKVREAVQSPPAAA
jgi:hypothetical protein